MRPCLAGALALSAAALAAAPALAAHTKKHADRPAESAAPKTRSLGSFGAWSAYVSQDSTGRVCYLAGPAQKSEPAGFGRKPPMAMVTHRPKEKIANVVSFVEGYPLKEGSDVLLEIGNGKFELFTKDDSAWARTSELDRTIVAALAKGKRAIVSGTPQKGPPTTDIYALAGFDKALAAIDKACGIIRERAHQPGPAHRHPKHRHTRH